MLNTKAFASQNDRLFEDARNVVHVIMTSGVIANQREYGLFIRPLESKEDVYLIIPFVQVRQSLETNSYYVETPKYMEMLRNFIFYGRIKLEVVRSKIPGFVEFVTDFNVGGEHIELRLFISAVFSP